MKAQVLIIDDNKEFCLSLVAIFEEENILSAYSTDGTKIDKILSNEDIRLVILDIRMPNINGIELLKLLKSSHKEINIIMVTAFPTIETAVNSMKVGALNYYTKPLDLKKFISEIKQLLGRSHSHNESEDYIISKSTEMKQLIDEAKKVAKTDAPVLITGESGTGKELFARLIHHTSNRSKEPFITINCAAIPENLLESELFGFEKGAFTNAHTTKIGKIEAASGGTLFLDEIGDMDLRLQAKILRVLQENEIERIGSNQVIKTNFRLISATNKNLREEFGKNTFREDLFYRLSVVSIHLLSLRERLIDINALTKYFIDIFNKKYSKNILGVTSAVDSILHRHKWPGNVRELKNCLERAVIFCEYEYLDIDNLPYQYQIMTEINNSNIAIEEKEHHRKIIEKALNDSNGVKQKAAELLNINRRTLYNRMKKLGML